MATMTYSDINHHISMLGRSMHNPLINCDSRAEELVNDLYSTQSMTLVLSGKTISVLHFADTLRNVGAQKSNHNEFTQSITGDCGLNFCSHASWKTGHTYIAHPGMFANDPSIGILAFSKLPPVLAKLKLQPAVLLPSGAPSSVTFLVISLTPSVLFLNGGATV
mmetsp:Transcript_15923/g.33855  ORF Transcript_15923/g.33855 Transcript_15923/m.33855 type:complete len:164 (+) Transcript_15923:222-713(+)